MDRQTDRRTNRVITIYRTSTISGALTISISILVGFDDIRNLSTIELALKGFLYVTPH
jgi:hypothetical protein